MNRKVKCNYYLNHADIVFVFFSWVAAGTYIFSWKHIADVVSGKVILCGAVAVLAIHLVLLVVANPSRRLLAPLLLPLRLLHCLFFGSIKILPLVLLLCMAGMGVAGVKDLMSNPPAKEHERLPHKGKEYLAIAAVLGVVVLASRKLVSKTSGRIEARTRSHYRDVIKEEDVSSLSSHSDLDNGANMTIKRKTLGGLKTHPSSFIVWACKNWDQGVRRDVFKNELIPRLDEWEAEIHSLGGHEPIVAVLRELKMEISRKHFWLKMFALVCDPTMAFTNTLNKAADNHEKGEEWRQRYIKRRDVMLAFAKSPVEAITGVLLKWNSEGAKGQYGLPVLIKGASELAVRERAYNNDSLLLIFQELTEDVLKKAFWQKVWILFNISSPPKACIRFFAAESERVEQEKCIEISNSTEDGRSEYELQKKPDVTFDQIAGMKEAKSSILEMVVYPVKNPDKAKALHIKPGGGVLLYGPPGNGKTMFGKAIAHEIDAPFFYASGAELLSKWHGESEQNLSRLIKSAQRHPVAVLFLDELDGLLPRRTDSSQAVDNRLVTQFLADIGGFRNSNNVLLVLGATNKPWEVDEAVFRTGRFDEKIYIGLPDYDARLGMLKMALCHLPLQKGIVLEAWAKSLDGYTGSDIISIVEVAKRRAFHRSISEKAEPVICELDVQYANSRIPSSVTTEMLDQYEAFNAKRFNGNSSA